MKKHIITALLMTFMFLTSCFLQGNKEKKNQEFNGIDKSSMDMIYYPDGFAYKKTFKDFSGDSIVARIIFGRPKKNGREVLVSWFLMEKFGELELMKLLNLLLTEI